ncbi:hypothetical protein CSPX01_17345 [Colletotrichum filicis]|nr:hypothetical protein CSPX01_17345 [Colletotrichum filicis]
MSELSPGYKDTYVHHEEMPLSRRVLHFCAQEVVWVCREKDPQSLWYRTVNENSRLRLSKEQDKMAALSGLAKQMQSLRPPENRYQIE